MAGLLIGGLLMGAVLVGVALALGSLFVLFLARSRPSLSNDLLVRLSAAPMPILAMVALLAMILTPIGVDDNGPQISGGIMIAIGLIVLAAFGYVVGSLSARWTLGKIRNR